MTTKIINISNPRHNTEEQCVPCVLHTIIKNQFSGDKKARISKLSYAVIKKYIRYNPYKKEMKRERLSGKDMRILKDMFHGTFNLDLHMSLNPKIKDCNIILEHRTGFDINIIKELLDKNIYPILLVNPAYINHSEVNNKFKLRMRGEPKGAFTCIAIHGIMEDKLAIYDPDLIFKEKEILTENNIRVICPLGTIKKYSDELNNILFWFELRDKGKDSKITTWSEK